MMKIRTYILTFFVLYSVLTFGQEKIVDSLEIKRIDSLVVATTMEARNSSLKKIKIKSSKIKKSKNKSKQKITAFLKDKEVVLITSSENGTSKSCYYDKGKMIYQSYFIVDDSRASCGFMSVTGYRYYKENKVITSNEQPYEYNPCSIISTQTIGFEEIYEFIKNQNLK